MLIRKEVADVKFLHIVDIVLDGFKTGTTFHGNVGIPLGNVTSQLFANIMLHEFDLFVKHHLKEQHYLRFCDDFIFLSTDKSHLQSLIAHVYEWEHSVKRLSIKNIKQKKILAFGRFFCREK